MHAFKMLAASMMLVTAWLGTVALVTVTLAAI